MSLRTRLVALVLVAAVPVLAVYVHDQFRDREARRAAIAIDALTLANLQAERLSQLVGTARGLANATAHLREVSEGDTQGCQARVAALIQRFPEFVGIGVVGTDGRSFCRSSQGPPIFIGDRPYFKQVLETKQFVASGTIFGRHIQRPSLVFAAPALGETGEVVAVVVVAFDLKNVANLLARGPLPDGATVSLVDSAQGAVVARVPDTVETGATRDEAFPAGFSARARGTAVGRGLDGVERMYGYAPLAEPARFHAVVGLPLEPALARIDNRLWWSLALLIGIFASAAAVALIGAELGIRRPLRDLQRVARTLAGGNLSARTRLNRQAVGEVGALAASIDGMAGALRERETELRTSEAFNRRILASSRDCIKVLGLDGRVQSINDFGREVLEIGDEERVVGVRFEHLWPGESGALARQALEEAREGGATRFHGRRRTRSGKENWWDVAVTPISGPDGKPERLLVISRDVTEAKRAEAQREALMAELDHRVKNTLAAVQAIAARTLGRGDDVDRFAGRLEAMAQAHNLLSRSHWEGADLGELLRTTLSAYGRSIELRGPEAHLNARATQTLGMVMHELAANAAKYGALSEPDGRVAVTWRVENGERRRLFLDWRERDGPAVETPERQGFGLTFIERSVAHELGGETDIRFERDGLRCAIEIDLVRRRGTETGTVARRDEGPAAELSVLAGKRVLLVEDSLLAALTTEAILASAGCVVVGPAAALDEATDLARERDVDAAVLDVNLDGDNVFPLAAKLAAEAVPFVFITGYDSHFQFPTDFVDIPRVGKPVDGARLLNALAEALADGVDREADDASAVPEPARRSVGAGHGFA